jgi:Zn-dependent protease/CBS domain-containing protein
MSKQNAKSRSLSLPDMFGIPVRIHWTFTILIIWIIYINLRQGLDAAHIAWMIAFVLALFVCVILHELGHALAARRYGIQTKDITLYPIGGVARLDSMPEKPSQELVVALAGPMVNVVIMLLLSPFIMQLDLGSTQDTQERLLIDAQTFLPMLGIVNVWLALFNLIPAFPMDGGRVLRAILSMNMNRVKATRIAAGVGKLLAVGFVFAGLYFNPFLVFIGLFIILGAHSESEMVKTQAVLSGLKVRDALVSDYRMLDVNDTLKEAVQALLRGDGRYFIIAEGSKPAGMIGRDDIIRGLREHGEDAPLQHVVRRDVRIVDADTPLETVFPVLQGSGFSAVLVQDGRETVGFIDTENIAELLMVQSVNKAV